MNPRHSFMAVAPFALLLACSSPPSAPEPGVPLPQGLPPAPPPEVSIDLPLEPAPRREEFEAEFCQLGKSCLALDPRPFEACLLDTTRCKDKATEPLLAGEQSVEIYPPQRHRHR